MKPILFILLTAMSLSAFAQHSDPFAVMPPRIKTVLGKQRAAHGTQKITGTPQRLIGYSKYAFPGNTLTDTMHARYSGGRGSVYPTCQDNVLGLAGRDSQPDSIWNVFVQSNYVDNNMVYVYDNQNRIVTKIDNRRQTRSDLEYDNHGDNTITKYYDTVGSGNGTMIYKGNGYSIYDSQHRDICDSTLHIAMMKRAYSANGTDSIMHYLWDSTGGKWNKSYKEIQIFDTAGRVVFYYQLWGDTTSDSWDQGIRDSFVFSGNNLLLEYMQRYNPYSGSWISSTRSELVYTGSNYLPVSVTFYDTSNGAWYGRDKFELTLNNSGNWDTETYSSWDTTAATWKKVFRENFDYNSDNLVSKISTYNYNSTTGQFETSPATVETYYYEVYNPQDSSASPGYAPSYAITAYPNPVSGKLHIDGDIGNKNVSLQLMNLTGRHLYSASGNWQSMNKDIDMSAFGSGVYYLLIVDDSGNKIAAKQIVKN